MGLVWGESVEKERGCKGFESLPVALPGAKGFESAKVLCDRITLGSTLGGVGRLPCLEASL